jgi:hypothetical protein
MGLAGFAPDVINHSKGATTKHPSWGGNSIGFRPFPAGT